jgi:hypothetical protein
MGYRSDVGIIVAFDSLDNMREVLAVYLLDPRVKKYELMQHWDVFRYDTSRKQYDNLKTDTVYYVKLNEDQWKWYDGYDDVQGLKHLYELADKFAEEREGFNVSWKEVSIGEDGAISAAENGGDDLQWFCDYMLHYTVPELYWNNEEDVGNKEIKITLEKENA